MSISSFFPIWSQLTPEQQQRLEQSAAPRTVQQGTILHNGEADCVGLFLMGCGQLRAFILSDEGKEITLYRLLEGDICLFSASCMLSGIQFDLSVEAEKDSNLWVVPAAVYRELMEQSAPLANFTNELISSRFSEVMWLMDQILFRRFDSRLAGFLLEESAMEGRDDLSLTHDRIARHLGTAREVVTRMLKYFQSEGLVSLSRGGVRLTGRKGLEELARG